ncbi:hypothetical protein glysoja_046083, partial [Glycine soja]
APSKVLVFSWRLLLNRLPTHDQLLRRRILVQDQHQSCVFCRPQSEDKNLLILHCPVFNQIWNSVLNWIGVADVLPADISHLYAHMGVILWSCRNRKRRSVFWHVTCWCIWLDRTVLFFNGGQFDSGSIMAQIQRLS